jgi:hypothetical protein
VTVFWLFGLVSVVFALFGGPTGVDGISWATMGLGFGMWAISVIWTLLTTRGTTVQLSSRSSPRPGPAAAGNGDREAYPPHASKKD